MPTPGQRQHDVFDLDRWTREFPLPERYSLGSGYLDNPGDLAEVEQLRRSWSSRFDFGRGVPVDVFVWKLLTSRPAKPWLTRIGGIPWRPKNAPWPTGPTGRPLDFLGQVSFVDSRDLLPFAPPNDVVLFFGRLANGWVYDNEGIMFEAWPMHIDKPCTITETPAGTELPFSLEGVIHRTMNYPDALNRASESEDMNALFWSLELQMTCVGTRASLPQGWPYQDGDGNTLTACLSSVDAGTKWPFVNLNGGATLYRDDGRTQNYIGRHRLFCGSGGCMWIFRNAAGKFKLDYNST